VLDIEIKGTGIDIIEVSRVNRLIDKYGDDFISKVFTENEWRYCSSKSNPSIHLSLRIAAKEAVAKALGWQKHSIPWKDIEYNVDDEVPKVILNGRLKALAVERGIHKIIVSGTHSKEYAVCNAIAVSE